MKELIDHSSNWEEKNNTYFEIDIFLLNILIESP